MDNLKLTFIRQCLIEYNESAIAAMKIAAKRAGIGVTNEGLQSLAYEALQNNSGGTSTLSFKEYLRFVDMGVGRAHPLGGLRSVTVALHSSRIKGQIQVRDSIRKPKKFYSKIAYGKLSYLENKLLHGYTEEAIAQLKQTLESNGSNIA